MLLVPRISLGLVYGSYLTYDFLEKIHLCLIIGILIRRDIFKNISNYSQIKRVWWTIFRKKINS